MNETIDLTDREVALAWRRLIDEQQIALSMAHQALHQIREEVYISQDERQAKEFDAERLIRRISDDLIALGGVRERAMAARLVTVGQGSE